MEIQGRAYAVQIRHAVRHPPETPRLVMVSHVVNETAAAILHTSVRAIRHFTRGPHELWIVDNNSPMDFISPFLDLPDVNFVLNRTEPLPPGVDHGSQTPSQQEWGSYANAIALELAVRLVDPATCFFMSMHMDSLPCSDSWLDFLISHLTDPKVHGTSAKKSVAAAGVRMDTTRRPDGVLHVLGYVVDFQIFQRLGLTFFPDLPAFDVGDKVTVGLRLAGFDVFSCRNTLWEPELEKLIDPRSPYRNLKVDRSLDNNNNVIFAHLGRGVRKAAGAHSKGPTVEEWVAAAESNMLKSHPRSKG
ncbi:MAG: hypothetical protein QG577_1612 [Thermodesulfobacteriota bacterium]|nr:hypothetical protein [Thermodesulfobacteriota bacterium]